MFYKNSTCHWGKSSFNKQFKSSSSQLHSFSGPLLAPQTSPSGGEPGIAPDCLHYKPKVTSNSIINLTTCFKSVVSLNSIALRLMATLKQAGLWVRIKEPAEFTVLWKETGNQDLDLKQISVYIVPDYPLSKVPTQFDLAHIYQMPVCARNSGKR